MNLLSRAIASLWPLIAALPAQTIAGSFSPNPVGPGVPVTFTGTDAGGQGVYLPSPCTWLVIHAGTPTGPIVNLGLSCPSVLVPVAANGTFSFVWDQRDDTGQLVAPGRYWFEVRAYDNGFTTAYTDWFCISIQSPGVPALVAAGPARIGQSTALGIAAPGKGGAIWVAAASLSSNAPIVVPGLDICLGDPLFFGPFTTPVGSLDANGNSTGLQLIVPSAPSVLWQGLHVQALLFGAGGLLVTNDLSFTIQP